LLEDIYGNRSVAAEVRAIQCGADSYPRTLTPSGAASPPAILELASRLPNASDTSGSNDPRKLTFNEPDDYYNGCVLTMTTGSAKGTSARIIKHYRYDFSQYSGSVTDTAAVQRGIANNFKGWHDIFRVLVSKDTSGSAILPADGDQFVINGRPFSGTG